MAVSQTLKDKIFADYERNHYEMVVGQIQEYDESCNRANVYMYDPKNGEQVLLYNVPVEMSGLGLVSSGPFSGDQVYISFMNGSLLHPKIVGRADETFGYYTRSMTQHSKSGAYLSDTISGSSFSGSSPSSSGSAASQSWIDSGSSSVGNYMNYTGNATSGTSSSAANSAYYRKAEVGFTHPLNRSTMKVRDNGVIDIFTSTNYGIRINPNDGSVTMISNNQSQHASSLSQYVDSSFNVQVGGAYTQSASAYNVSASSGTFSLSVLNMSGTSSNFSFDYMTERSSSRTINADTMFIKADSYHQKASSFSLDASTAKFKHSSYSMEAADSQIKTNTYSVNASSSFEVNAAKGGITSRGKFSLESSAALHLKGLSATIEGQQINMDGLAAYLKAKDFNIEGTALTMKATSDINMSGTKATIQTSGNMTFDGKNIGFSGSKVNIESTDLTLDGNVKATGKSFNVTANTIGFGNGSCGISVNGDTIAFSGKFGGDFDDQVEEEIEKYFDKNFEKKIQAYLDEHLNSRMTAFFNNNFSRYFSTAHSSADHSKWMGGSNG